MDQDFNIRRFEAQQDVMRQLAQDCYKTCVFNDYRKLDAVSDDDRINIDLTNKEEKCVQECSGRVAHLFGIVNKHMEL